MLSVKVFPVAIKLVLIVLTLVVRVWPVVIRFPLTSSTTLPVETKLFKLATVNPETIPISLVRVCPVVIRFPLKSLKSCSDPPVAIPDTIAISSVKV